MRAPYATGFDGGSGRARGAGTEPVLSAPMDDGVPGPLGLASRSSGDVDVSIRSVEGRRLVWAELAGNPTTRLTVAAATQLGRAAAAAAEHHLPLVVLLTTSGASVDEGVPALDGWGRVAAALVRCSGTVPTVVIVDGPVVSGPAILLGVADLVVMTETSSAFVNGPAIVEEYTGIAVSVEELGGATNHVRYTGVAAATVADRDAAIEVVADLLSFLPDHVDQEPPLRATADPPTRSCPEAGALIPTSSTGSYDVRRVAAAIVDDGALTELRARWAGNVVTAFATIAGRPIGIVANQPTTLAGTLDIPASQKAARFVALCDAFNVPLLTLVDTPGFYPGKDLEWRGMIRHGAQLVYAYARASVPRICVILRKSYGGAYIVMDSKTMGNDLCLAWPWAELAVMGAGQAAAILQRRASDDERAAFERDYAERLLNPYVAAERGLVDAVVDPADTRREVAAALEVLADKRELLGGRKHGNTPL
jgi:propionyl-CoA carboxylase beta chain